MGRASAPWPLQLRRYDLLLAVSALLLLVVKGAVLSPELDAEIVQLHAATEDSWARISNLTSELEKVGAIASGSAGGLPAASVGAHPAMAPQMQASQPRGSPQEVAGGNPSGDSNIGSDKKVPVATLTSLRQLQSEFTNLQQSAFRIGRESENNDALAQHPEVNNYVQSLREMKPQLQSMISNLEKELTRITGKQIEKPKKRKKQTRTIQGLSENEIRARTRAELLKDKRPFRAKALDLMSTFRERQMQMQDKQRDMQLAMDGPDWPKEDWPLSTDDARYIGEAENMISSSLQQLNAKINPFGGLSQVHEAGDDSVLEQMVALNDMMTGYGELIDRHVETVKKVYRKSKKPRKSKAESKASKSKQTATSSSAELPGSGGTLRDRLLNFGAQNDDRQPFAWLRDQDSSSAGVGSGALGGLNAGSASTPLGSLGSFAGGVGAQTMPAGLSTGGSNVGSASMPLGSLGSFAGGVGAQTMPGGLSTGGQNVGSASTPLGSLGSFAGGIGEQTMPGGLGTGSAATPLGSTAGSLSGGFASQNSPGGLNWGSASAAPLGSMTGSYPGGLGPQTESGRGNAGASASSPLGSISGSFSGGFGSQILPGGFNAGGASAPMGSRTGGFSAGLGSQTMPNGLHAGGASTPLGSMAGSFPGGLGSQKLPGGLNPAGVSSPLGSMTGSFSGGFGSQNLGGGLNAGGAFAPLGGMSGGFSGGFGSQHLPPQRREL